jgi:hypothetical protein
MSMIMQWDAVDPATISELRTMDGEAFVEWLEDAERRISFDVDKAWHAVHFTLAGDAWETEGVLGSVVLGGDDFGEDLGYGHPRWLPADAVAAAARELADLTPEAFEARLDFAAMVEHDIYPGVWDRDPEEEELVEYVVDGYREIRGRFAEAAASGQGFVICLL